jgi:predicted transcriptional regulator
VKAVRECYVEGSLECEIVIQATHLEFLRNNPERAAPWHDFIDNVWVYEGRVPIDMHILDEVVLVWLGKAGEDGLEVHGILEIEDPEVLSWATSLYEEFRAEAEPVDPTMLTGQ